jgi:thioredoxin-like negative regulator of GroEL
MDYKQKYLKYKSKYLELQKIAATRQMTGGSDKTEIYLFKAEWCPHCVAFKPVWNKLQTALKGKYTFVTVDADKDKDKIKQWGIEGFPTIIKRVGNNAVEYNGPRDEVDLMNFINGN